LKEKEQKLAVEKAQDEQARLKQEEEEIKKIRAESNFKATPIKKYRSGLGSVTRKNLTIPVSPKLETNARAEFKDESAGMEQE